MYIIYVTLNRELPDFRSGGQTSAMTESLHVSVPNAPPPQLTWLRVTTSGASMVEGKAATERPEAKKN